MMRPLFMLPFIALSLAVPASAQDAPASPPVTYTITFTSDQLLYVANTLRRMPYADVADLLSTIQTQLNEQEAKRKAALVPSPAPTPEAK